MGKVMVTGASGWLGQKLVARLASQKKDIIFAIQLAIANSGSCISEWGAKNGLLKKGQKWEKVKVERKKI